MFKDIVENQDLYRKKDDFWKNKLISLFFHFRFKIYIGRKTTFEKKINFFLYCFLFKRYHILFIMQKFIFSNFWISKHCGLQSVDVKNIYWPNESWNIKLSNQILLSQVRKRSKFANDTLMLQRNRTDPYLLTFIL